MVDYVKIAIYNQQLIKRIWKNNRLTLYSEKEQTVRGRKKTYHKKTYLGLTFNLLEDRLEITGSLHKYFNNGVHNANDFSITDCIQTVSELKEVFSLDLSQCKIVNLEFGLNLLPDTDVQTIIYHLLLHGKNQFRPLPNLEHAKQAGSFNARGYLNEYKFIKAYAKGFEPFKGRFYCDPNTFRFEVKSKQSKCINRWGIFTLEDLTNLEVYNVLAEELINEWSVVLLLDDDLPDNHEVAKYKSLDFWEEALNGKRNSFSRAKRNYLKALKEYPDNLHHSIHSLLLNKLNQFFDEIESGANSRGLQDQGGADSIRQQEQIGANSTIHEKGYNAYSTIVKLETASKRCCLATGLPIHMQKTTSKFLTPVGLKWYNKHDPQTYNRLKSQFLPRSGISGQHTRYERDELKHLAKQIRNQYHNPNRYKTKDCELQLCCF